MPRAATPTALGPTRSPHFLGEAHGMAKLTEQKVREIRSRHAAGELQRELARAFGVSRSAIGLIVHRLKWRHVDAGDSVELDAADTLEAARGLLEAVEAGRRGKRRVA